MPGERVSKHGYRCWSGGWSKFDDLLGRGGAEAGQQVVLGLGHLCEAAEGAGRAGEGATCRRSSSRRMTGQVVAARVSAIRTSSNDSQQRITWARGQGAVEFAGRPPRSESRDLPRPQGRDHPRLSRRYGEPAGRTGLILNVVTLRDQNYPVRDGDAARLSAFRSGAVTSGSLSGSVQFRARPQYQLSTARPDDGVSVSLTVCAPDGINSRRAISYRCLWRGRKGTRDYSSMGVPYLEKRRDHGSHGSHGSELGHYTVVCRQDRPCSRRYLAERTAAEAALPDNPKTPPQPSPPTHRSIRTPSRTRPRLHPEHPALQHKWRCGDRPPAPAHPHLAPASPRKAHQ